MVMRIKALRKAVGMSQIEFGAAVGVNQSSVSAWEREICLPKARDLPLVAKVLQCSIDDLFEKEEPCEAYTAI